MICSKCGAKNTEGSIYCDSCLTQLISDTEYFSDSDILGMDKEKTILNDLLPLHYHVKHRIGSGNLSNVYLARDFNNNNLVTIKVISAKKPITKDSFKKYVKDIRIWTKIKHPNIAKVYLLSDKTNPFFYVMEYFNNGSFANNLKNHNKISISVAIKLISQVCSALLYSYDKRLFHSNLKPSNIFIEKDYTLKISDFGITKYIENSTTKLNTSLETYLYMSPEQAKTNKVDERSNIYSIGIMLYQMVTGSLPFESTNKEDLVRQHINKKSEPADLRNKDIPEGINNIIMKCIEKNPEKRFQNFDLVLNALNKNKENVLNTKPINNNEDFTTKLLNSTADITNSKSTPIKTENNYVIQYKNSNNLKNNEEKETKKSFSPVILIISLVSIIAILVSFNIYNIVQNSKNSNEENSIYKIATLINSKESYSNYVLLYPSGKFKQEALMRISEIESQKVSTTEEQILEEVISKNTIEDFQEYLNMYPDGKYTAVIQNLIDIKNVGNKLSDVAYNREKNSNSSERYSGLDSDTSSNPKPQISNEDIEYQDFQAYRVARRSNTKKAYDIYISNFPEGLYLEEARKNIEKLSNDPWEWITLPRFEKAKSFSEGLAPVKENGKWGYINMKGELAIKPFFDDSGVFKDNVAVIKLGNKFGWTDKNGTIVIQPIYDDVSYGFSEGLAAVKIINKWGYIDKESEVVIPMRYILAQRFSEDLAAVSNENGKWGYINKNGDEVLPFEFDYAYEFHEGLAAVKINNKLGYINKIGQMVINPQFDRTYGFSDGFADVRLNDKVGFIDKKGEQIIPPQFEQAYEFNEGLAAVKVGDKWGYIDKTGNIVIEPTFDGAWSFRNGLATINIGDTGNHLVDKGKWGWIDKKGNFFIKPQFDKAYDFSSEGLALIQIQEKWAFIRLNNKMN